MKKMPAPQASIFDIENRLIALSKRKDPLEQLNKHIDWSIFIPILAKLDNLVSEKDKGGRPAYDTLLLFKMLILQKIYGLSDYQLEIQVLDRLTFIRFLEITASHPVPDQNTIWNFREKLKAKGLDERLFKVFSDKLKQEGHILNEGKVIDATFIEAPKQHNKPEENEQIKNMTTPEEWENNPDKLAQKDLDARWAMKNKETHYGYKDHVIMDSGSKLIEGYTVTDAAVHDSCEMLNLMNKLEDISGETDADGEPKKHEIYADSAYKSEEIEAILAEFKAKSMIHERAYKNKPLTEAQKENNKLKSKKRVRVEHVFGYMSNSLGGTFVRTIGIARAWVNIGLLNLTYNLKRYVVLKEAAIVNLALVG